MTARPSSPTLWLALSVPPLAWFAYQQGLGAVLRVRCAAAGGGWGTAVGLAAAAACALAAAYGARAAGRADTTASARLLGRVTAWGAAIFAVAILLQMAAAAIVPPCAR